MPCLIVEDMTSSDEPLSLADQRAAVTRDAIIEATQTLLIEKHPATLSIPAVAKQAGVSVRTVYRYFPNKQELLDGIAKHFPDQSHGAGRWVLDTFDENEAGLIRLWSAFTENLPAVRAEHQSPAGSELRERRLGETRIQMAKLISANFPSAPQDELDTLVDITIALTSSSMFLELHDRLGNDADTAARLAIWAAKALHAEFAANGLDALSPPSTSTLSNETSAANKGTTK